MKIKLTPVAQKTFWLSLALGIASLIVLPFSVGWGFGLAMAGLAAMLAGAKFKKI